MGHIFLFKFRIEYFFSDHIGILFNLAYTGYQYNSVKAEFNDNATNIFGSSASLDWDMALKGVNIGTGLAVKF